MTGRPGGMTSAAATAATVALVRSAAADGGRPAPGGRLVLAVDGRSGAGKTTLAGCVAAVAAADLTVVTLAMDDVYPGWDGLAAAAERLVTDVLEPLALGGRPGIRRWDWVRGAEQPWQALHVPAGGLLVVEGAGAASRGAAPYLSAVVWLDGDEATRRTRALLRDGDTYAPHWDRWAAQEVAYAAREQAARRADLLIELLLPEPAAHQTRGALW